LAGVWLLPKSSRSELPDPDINETVERKAINREQDFGAVGSMTSAKEGRPKTSGAINEICTYKQAYKLAVPSMAWVARKLAPLTCGTALSNLFPYYYMDDIQYCIIYTLIYSIVFMC
jgi:hypothetical protein